MIEIEHLNKTYPSPTGDIHALRDVDLRIEDGEIFGIIGLSGAGKSTLVRCINLLERPTSGTVRIDGRDMTQLSRRDLLKARQDIGMIFQSFNLLEQRTVLRNICFPLEIAGIKREEAQARAEELLELVGLSDRAKAYPSQLSGGQKQRVAVIDQSCIAEIGNVSDVFTHPKSDIAKALILPKSPAENLPPCTGKRLRLVFDGSCSNEPVISRITLECHVPVNILFADTRIVEGSIYGHMVIDLPDDPQQFHDVLRWLEHNHISYLQEV